MTCLAKTSISQAARLMAEMSVGSVVVVDDGHRVVGMLTDRDIAIRAVARELQPDAEVEAIMTHEVASVRADADLATAARQMSTRGCRRLPVVDEAGCVMAVVSADDLYRVGSEVLAELDHVLGRSRRGNH